jgi:hypothetical protein
MRLMLSLDPSLAKLQTLILSQHQEKVYLTRIQNLYMNSSNLPFSQKQIKGHNFSFRLKNQIKELHLGPMVVL